MTIEQNAEGCLLGLACGDALGRPLEFNSAAEIESKHGDVTEMLGHGTHGQPPGTITDDTEMALCIAESLADRRGFDPDDVASRFVEWLESRPFDIGLMTRDSLSRIREGASWDEAGVDVWESRPEGSNAGNGSVMRCAPYAIAFRHFDAELTQVSQLSSAITHADPRCRWGCVILNRTLANLIRNERDPLGTALTNTSSAPEELRTALTQVQDVITGDHDAARFEAQLSTSGYVVDSLQAGLYYGLTAESAESAIFQAVNSGGDTDTVGAIAGAVAGARFGAPSIPNRWTKEIEESDRLKRLAQRLLTIRMPIPGKRYTTMDDGTIVFRERTIEGPAYISAGEFQEATIGHRPHPAPHRTIRTAYHELTPATAAMLDWERRAYAVHSDRCSTYAAPVVDLDEESDPSGPSLVPLPQYSFVDAFDDLPEQDQQRIKRDGQAAADAFVQAYAAFAGIRHSITEGETETVGIERMDPIAGATRVLVGAFADAGEALLRRNEIGGYDSPADIEAAYDVSVAEEMIAAHPSVVYDVAEIFPQLTSGTGAILDYITHLRLPQEQLPVRDTSPEDQLAELCDTAHTMVGELHVMYESLRRVAVRHPEIQHEKWQANTALSGVDE
ncbi:ADP-ribosylglycohydrolase family protein [Halorubrum ezzemoulense]|uniref:ADP-ribosylglycohydrolase family protein n=1 Tax=Halorubrum ezzemoulense TaxID=337243 RepID=UPI002AA2B5BD|nr:ADP-ribosylglycohydrolase family protein [Halorubrum ezzemoulense]